MTNKELIFSCVFLTITTIGWLKLTKYHYNTSSVRDNSFSDYLGNLVVYFAIGAVLSIGWFNFLSLAG